MNMRYLAITLLAACATSDEIAVEDRPQLVIDCSQPPTACALPVDSARNTFESATEVKKLVTGVWISCPPPPTFHPDWVGLELRKSHQFSILVPDGAGRCVRGVGPEYEGEWWIEDISEQNPKGTYQISMRWNTGATAGRVPAVTTSPKWMRDRGPSGGTWAAPD